MELRAKLFYHINPTFISTTSWFSEVNTFEKRIVNSLIHEWINSTPIQRNFLRKKFSSLKKNLLTAYWGRDSTQAAAAASSQLFGSPFGAAAAGLGLLPGTGGSNNDRYSMNNHQHHQNTMAVAASQAASLAGLHPASK